MQQESELKVLAAMIAAEIKGAPPKPKLRLVRREDFDQQQEDSVFRASRIDRIRWIARSYGLSCIVNQHTFGTAGIDCLDTPQLVALHKDIEQARECCIEGISLDEALLIRNNSEP